MYRLDDVLAPILGRAGGTTLGLLVRILRFCDLHGTTTTTTITNTTTTSHYDDDSGDDNDAETMR